MDLQPSLVFCMKTLPKMESRRQIQCKKKHLTHMRAFQAGVGLLCSPKQQSHYRDPPHLLGFITVFPSVRSNGLAHICGIHSPVLLSALSTHEIRTERALNMQANSSRHFRAAKNALNHQRDICLLYYTIFMKNAKKEREHDAE